MVGFRGYWVSQWKRRSFGSAVFTCFLAIGLLPHDGARAQSLEDLMAVYRERCGPEARTAAKAQGAEAARQSGLVCDALSRQIQDGTEELAPGRGGSENSLARPDPFNVGR